MNRYERKKGFTYGNRLVVSSILADILFWLFVGISSFFRCVTTTLVWMYCLE